MNIFQQWKQRRRDRMWQELSDVQKRIDFLDKECAQLKTRADSILSQPTMDVEFVLDRRERWLKIIREDKNLMASLGRKLGRLKKKLGHP